MNKTDLIMYLGVFILVTSLWYHPLLYFGLGLQIIALIIAFAKGRKHDE